MSKLHQPNQKIVAGVSVMPAQKTHWADVRDRQVARLAHGKSNRRKDAVPITVLTSQTFGRGDSKLVDSVLGKIRHVE